MLLSLTSGIGDAADGVNDAPEKTSLVFIDAAVDQVDRLIAGVADGSDVVVLAADRDGIVQVSEHLRRYDRLQSVHIVSHGSPGRLALGNGTLDHDSIRSRHDELRSWATSLATDADILLYGCNVAQNGGERLATLLGDLVGVDVAASVDATGSADMAGDWDLEFTTGPIEAPSPFGSNLANVGGISLALPANFSDGVVLSGLNQPVDVQTLPTGEMLILQKPGTIILTNPLVTPAQATTYLTIPNVDSAEEKGLLSIALDPDFANNNYIYVYYHNSTTDRGRISRFVHDVDHAHAGDEFVIWEDNLDTAAQSIGYHWGGGFGFGPDNYLYLAIGDKWDTPMDAQDPALTAGKIIRVNPGGAGAGAAQWAQGAANAHLVPQTNPFVDGAGGLRDEVWALGLRNAFRMFWDLPTGKLFIGEVGGNIQSGADASHEDIHLARTTSGGANFGWPLCEGPAADCTPSAPANFSPPIFSIQHTDARSITMGPVYRGSLFPSTYYGALFFADYTRGWLRYLTFDAAGNVSSSVPVGGFPFAGNGDLGSPVALEIGVDEALYYVNIVAGTLRRIGYNSGNAPPVITQASANPTSSPTAPLTVNFTGSAFDPEGQALTYTWTFGDGTQATGASPSHQYTAKGTYEAVLRVADSLRTSTSDPIRITVGEPPVPTIDTPANGSLFRAGDVIQVRGSATDDGALTNANLKWTFQFLHDDHYHPILSGLTGTACAPTGSSCRTLTIPLSGHDYSGETGYRLILDVTDSDGISASTSVMVRPDKVDLTFNSNVPGDVPFTIDGIPRNGPFVLDTLKGFQHAVSVPAVVQAGGNLYAFASWSNGPTTVLQDVTVPNSNLTLTANYTDLGPVGTGPFVQQPDGTVAIQAEDYDASIASGGSWSTTTPPGATGPFLEAVQAGSGGRLEYLINFNRTGTHYVYIRAFGPNHKSNSAYIGFDGNWQIGYDNIVPLGSWQWIGPVAINVGSTGQHTLGLTMRESGALIDKIAVLATATAPTGAGPADTPREGGGGGGNTPPSVTITAPADGSSFNVGDMINFTGTATDTQDGNIASGLSWNSSINGNFGGSGSVQVSTLSAGVHTITASVTDSGSANGSDSIQVTVIDPGGGGGGGTGPYVQQANGTVAIQAEDYDASVASGGSWSTATPAGATGPFLEAVQAGNGGRLEYRIDFNRTGTHYVYVRAFGPNHKSNSAWVGFDGNWEIDYAHIVPLGSWQWIGPIAINVGSTGLHTLGLSMRESDTLIDKIAVLTTATAPTGSGPADTPREGGGGGGGNTPPSVTITAPADTSSFNIGDMISFTGTATDTQDGDIASGLSWNSNINGNFGMSGSVQVSTLSAGVHTITASVTDSGSANGSDSIQVTVIDPGGGGGGGTGPFVQQANGTVSMQAEDYDTSITSGGAWSTTNPAGATGPLLQAAQAGNGGRLEYRISFDRTGPHYVYVRAYGPNYKSNSAFIGFDGSWQIDYANIIPLGSWQWIGPIAINVGSTGVHTLGLSMRESDALIDKIVVLPTAATPTGTGPADSPRAP